MPKEEKPLPTPPGKRGGFRSQEESPLMADRIAAAMSEGKLEEFLKAEVPDNEYAGQLVSMMMGMTGMAPESFAHPAKTAQEQPPDAAAVPPPDLMEAVKGGDPRQVMEILRREHEKRSPGSAPENAQARQKDAGLPGPEKEVLDQLVKIASDNSVTIDWLVMRALRVYIADYAKTGRL